MATLASSRLTTKRRGLAASLAAVLLGLLSLQLVVLPRAATSVVEQFPEVSYLRVPGIVWEVTANLLLEAIVAILIYLLVSKARRTRQSFRLWIKAILIVIAALAALILAAIAFLTPTGYATPGVMLALFLGLGAAVVAAAVASYTLTSA